LDVLTHSILPFFGILLGLLVVHEAGHYITAKMFGVKVLEAGIGLPPRIAGFTWRGTDYTLNAIPMGAFVRMLGEEDPTDPQSLAAQPKWKRTVIIGAGVFMNLVLAITLFSTGLMIPHNVSIAGAQIADVVPNSPAARPDPSCLLPPSSKECATLKPGDQILAVNGRHVDSQEDASYFLRLYQGSNIDLTIKRADPKTGPIVLTKSVYSRWNPKSYNDECGVERTQGPIGLLVGPAHTDPYTATAVERAKIEAQSEKDFAAYKSHIAAGAPSWCLGGSAFGFRGLTAAQCSALEPQDRAAAEALKAKLFASTDFACYEFTAPAAYTIRTERRSELPWEAAPHGTRLSFESLILARNQIWGTVRGFGDSPFTGPVGIAQATGEVVDQAGWLSLLNFAALISMSLAMLNALPIPMVDGGRLAFIFVEFLRRGKRVAPEKEALVHLAGFAAMLLFAAVITFFDISRIVHGEHLLK
jgi:regulator of sigma E protease